MVPAVVNAVKILQQIARSPEPMGATAVARAIGLSQSSCFTIMKTLVAENLLTFDSRSKTYDIGLGAGEFATKLRFTAEAVFRPRIDLLADQYGVLATVWQIVHPDSIVVIAKASGMHIARIEMTLGWTSALYSGSIGRCIAAITTESDVQRRTRFERAPWQGAITYQQWLTQVEDARSRGWAVDHSQFVQGVVTVATVVTDADDVPRYAISSLMFRDQHDSTGITAIGMHSRALAKECGALLFGTDPAVPPSSD